MLDHGQMGKVCTTKREELNEYFKRRPPASRERKVAQYLHTITNTFVLMLQHRHTADYDGATKWSRTDTLDKIQLVDAAFESWREIREEPVAQNFLVTLLLRERK